MALKKKKLGERIGGGLKVLKGIQDTNQVFSIVSDEIFSYDYHFDDVYGSLGRFMCLSEFDDNGKVVKKAQCCKIFKKKQDRVVIPVILYEGKKKSYRKLSEGEFRMLSITSYKYNDLCKQLDDAGVDLEDCNVDLILKCEDERRGKISFEVLDQDEDALWKTDDTMKKMVKDAMATWEEDVTATLPQEYTEEELLRLVKEAEEEDEEPEGVEKVEKKKKSSEKDDIPKKKKKKDLDDDLDSEDESESEDEDEKPKKKKKSVKEQIEEEDLDNSELDSEEDEDELEDPEDEDLDPEDDEPEEKPKKKKKRPDPEDDEEDEDDE